MSATSEAADSDSTSIEEMDANQLRSYVANETSYKGTGDEQTLREKARGEFEPEGSEDSSSESEGEDGLNDSESGEEEEAGLGSTSGAPKTFSAAIEAQYLKSAIAYAGAVMNEARLHVGEEGLLIIGVDPANVSMLELYLDSQAFESLKSDRGVLGVNIERIQDKISLADSSDLIHLELNHSTKKLTFQYGGLEATMALVDPDSIRTEPEIPDIQHSAEVKLKYADLKTGIDAADMVDDHVVFAVDEQNEKFNISAEGDTDSINQSYDERALVTISPGEAFSIFSLEYLKDLTKPIDKNAVLTIEIGEEFPLLINYDFADGQGTVTNMVAPRINSEG